MLSFFKRNKSEQVQIPDWASFLDNKEYAAFITTIDNYFKKLGIDYELSDGIMYAQENDLGFNQLGLVNVAQVCKQFYIHEYPEVVRNHFNALIDNLKFDNEFKKIENDFEKVKSYLGVRLYHDRYFESVGLENVVGYFLTDSIYLTLVFDNPTAINSIKPEQIEIWGTTPEELIEIGKKNIKDKYLFEIVEEQINDLKIWFVQGEHFFIPNIVLDLENYKTLLGSNGALIGIPHRHACLIYPIESLETVNAITTLIPVIHNMNQEGPGSLTSDLYYYRDGKLINLPYQIEDNKIQFTPPAEFLEVLNTLK